MKLASKYLNNSLRGVTITKRILDYAHRVVTIRDGVIASDHPSTRTRNQ